MSVVEICKRSGGILLAILLLTWMLAACSGGSVTEVADTSQSQEFSDTPAKKVGVLLPSKEEQRWGDDAENLTRLLEGYGYQVTVDYAVNNSYIQCKQIEKLLEQQVDCLVIGAADPYKLSDCLKEAKEQGVSVIAYDRLLMDTDAVSYYATFDNFGVGVAMGSYVKEKEKLDKVRKSGGHKTIEFFMGSPDDNNARWVYEGIMQVLGEYLEDGTLMCNSGRTNFTETSILHWSSYLAQKDAVFTLRSDYAEEKLDIVCCANDNICAGIVTALEKEGYTQKDWPLLTGQDADIAAIQRIIEGKQAMSVYKDTRALADKCAGMVKATIEGTKPEINNRTDFNNDVIDVPTYMCTTIMVDKSNYQEILIEGGYYTASQIEEKESQ